MTATPAALAPVAASQRMHVIVVGNEKGGAGKSTVAMHLLTALLRMGRRVASLDLDPRQRTLTRYLDNRAEFSEASSAKLPLPDHLAVSPSPLRDLDAAEKEETARFGLAMTTAAERYDFLVIDAPGSDTHLSRLAHARADTLVTPLNDSFIDFQLLAEVDPVNFEIGRPSIYAEMVWESRKRKAAAALRPIDWVVLRNRMASTAIVARNQQRMGEALRALSSRIGFRVAPGLSERVVYRELFPKGLTLLDMEVAGRDVSLSQIAARQELRDLFIVLKLPGLDGERLRF